MEREAYMRGVQQKNEEDRVQREAYNKGVQDAAAAAKAKVPSQLLPPSTCLALLSNASGGCVVLCGAVLMCCNAIIALCGVWCQAIPALCVVMPS